MANKTAGVKLTVDGLSSYINDLQKAGAANQSFIDGFGKGNIGASLTDAGRQGASAWGIGFAAGIGAALGTAVIDAAKAAVNFGVDILKAGFEKAELIVKIGIDYQQAIADIEAGLSLIHPELSPTLGSFDPAVAKQLKDTINSIAIDPRLVVDFDEAASAAKTLTRYGFSVGDISNGALRSTVLLQNALGGTFTLASETLAKYSALFNLKPTDLQQGVSEIAATVVQGGFRDLNDYRYALTNSAGALQVFGASQEDVNTLLAVSNHLYASGRTDGTGLRNFVEGFVPTTDKAADAQKALNLQLFNAKGQFIGLQPAVRQIRAAFSKLTEEQKIYYAETAFGGKVGGRFLLTLLSQTTDQTIADTEAIIKNADASKAAAISAGTLGERLKNTAGQIESLAASLFPEEAQNQVTKALGAFQDLLTGLQPRFQAVGQSIADYLQPGAEALAATINQLAQSGTLFQRFNFGDLLKGFTSIDLNKLIFGGGIDLGALTITGGIDLSKHIIAGEINIPDFLKLTGAFDLKDMKFAGNVDFTGLSVGLDSITAALGLLSVGVQATDQSLQQITSPTGSIGQAGAFIDGFIKNITQTINNIDPAKAAGVGLAIGTATSSVLNLLTSLSNIAGSGLSTAVRDLSDLTTGLLNFATGVTGGIDATAVSASATGFVTSVIDSFTKVLSPENTKLVGIADAASNLVLSISGKFKEALAPGNLTGIGESLGGLATTIIGQIGSVLSDKRFSGQLGQSFANIIVGITQGLGDILSGFNSKTDNALQNAQISGGITSFVNHFLQGVTDGLEKANYGSVVSAFVNSFLGALTGGKEVQADIADISKNGLKAGSLFKLLKDINDLGTNPFVQAGQNLATGRGKGQEPKDLGNPVANPVPAGPETTLAIARQHGVDIEAVREASRTSDRILNSLGELSGFAPLGRAIGNAFSSPVPVTPGTAGPVASRDFTSNLDQLNAKALAAAQGLDQVAQTAPPAANTQKSFVSSILDFFGRGAPYQSSSAFVVTDAGKSAEPKAPKGVLADLSIQLGQELANMSANIGQTFSDLSISLGNTLSQAAKTLEPFTTALQNFASAIGSLANALIGQIQLIPGLEGFGKGAPAQPAGGGIGVTGANGASSPKTIVVPNPNPLVNVPTPLGELTRPAAPTGVPQISQGTINAGTVVVTGNVVPQNQANNTFIQQQPQTLPPPTQPGQNFIPESYTQGLTEAGTTLAQGASDAATTIKSSATSVQTGAATAGTNLASVPFFPGWDAYVTSINIPDLVPPFPGWDYFLNQIGPPPASSKQVLGFASGTSSVPKTASYVVGEKGPELVTLSKGSEVTPAGETGTLLDRGKNLLDSLQNPPPIPTTLKVTDVDASALKNAPPLPANIEPKIAPDALKNAPPLPANIAPKLGPITGASGTGAAAALAGAAPTRNDDRVASIIEQLKGFQDASKGLNLSIQDLQTALKGIPGILSASPVTQDQLDAAKAGIPQNFADDFVRRLADQVQNGKTNNGDLLGQATEALQKAGITPGANPDAILAQIKAGFSSGELFSNPENLSLINTDAVKASLEQQGRQKQGASNEINFLTSLFGNVNVGDLIGGAVQDAVQGSTKGGKGGGIAGAAGGSSVPAFPGWTGKDGVIPPFPAWKGKDSIIPVFPGWDQKTGGFIPVLDWTDFIDSLSKATTPDTTTDTTTPDTTTGNARGTNSFRGGASITGENGPELGIYPPGTRIFPARQTSSILSIAQALGRQMPSIYSDPEAAMREFFSGGSDYGRTNQQQTTVIFQAPRQGSGANAVRNFNLTLQTAQNSQGVMRDFQYMQVVGGI